MVPLHPQRVPGEPDSLRWIVPAGLLPCEGPLARVPSALAALLADGTLERVTAEPAAVVTRLGAGRSWGRDGASVRTALHAALAEPAGWGPADGKDTGTGSRSADDALLYAAARDVLAGTVGDFARSHGGAIELVGVHRGVVTVRLGGACRGCPASWLTLHQRLERELRRRCPGLVEVRDTGA